MALRSWRGVISCSLTSSSPSLLLSSAIGCALGVGVGFGCGILHHGDAAREGAGRCTGPSAQRSRRPSGGAVNPPDRRWCLAPPFQRRRRLRDSKPMDPRATCMTLRRRCEPARRLARWARPPDMPLRGRRCCVRQLRQSRADSSPGRGRRRRWYQTKIRTQWMFRHPRSSGGWQARCALPRLSRSDPVHPQRLPVLEAPSRLGAPARRRAPASLPAPALPGPRAGLSRPGIPRSRQPRPAEGGATSRNGPDEQACCRECGWL